ncbi:MAG: hypothetical protein JWP81_3041 [Ferruginibacter sp.]|nr:hypothetical protein [Ferruginibacter sp.]
MESEERAREYWLFSYFGKWDECKRYCLPEEQKHQ